MNLVSLKKLFVEVGAKKLYAKLLAENDNSKNQIYFAGAVEALNVFPSKQVFAENTARGPSFKATLDFSWLLESGAAVPAPHAQLILYSQYPEVRFSGFLKGCKEGPSNLMVDRIRAKFGTPEQRRQLIERILFLGVTGDGRVLGHVAAGDSELAKEFKEQAFPSAFVVFREIALPTIPDKTDSREQLLTELHRINQLGWIDSKQLDSKGILSPCRATQCGGYTLEAELGISKNSIGEPDFLGWEVKQYAVPNFNSMGAAITLMTPEPTGGVYKEQGVSTFIRKFGYPDKSGRLDRWNFGGVHKAGIHHKTTNLTMQLIGYDATERKITDAGGALALISNSGEIAAKWAFAGLLAHWSRKHMQAVYIPSICRRDPQWQYCYGTRVRLAQQTDSLRLLSALADGLVYYDPGIKLENASTENPNVKRRSQFRIASKNIGALYKTVETVDV